VNQYESRGTYSLFLPMIQKRNKAEAQTYDRLMYPGTEPRVPINKLNIRNWDNLEKKEAEIVFYRLSQGLPEDAKKLTYAGFKAIHEHLFQDIYEWAGKERTYTTGRNAEAPFAPPGHITSWMEKQFQALHKDNDLRNLPPQEFSQKAANLVNEINAAHPFIEGNGRVQRVWLRQLAEQAGYSLDIRAEDREAWNKASKVGFLALDHRPMAQLIESRLTPLQERTTNQNLANYELSKIYLNSSRQEASQNPALRNAVNLEVYIERKLRAQYHDDPKAVEHGLSVARSKIADMIIRGVEIETPKVIDNSQQDRQVKTQKEKLDQKSFPEKDR